MAITPNLYKNEQLMMFSWQELNSLKHPVNAPRDYQVVYELEDADDVDMTLAAFLSLDRQVPYVVRVYGPNGDNIGEWISEDTLKQFACAVAKRRNEDYINARIDLENMAYLAGLAA